MAILRKGEATKPDLPKEFHVFMGEAVREKFLENRHKALYTACRENLVTLVKDSPTIVLEVGSSIGKKHGSLLGFLTAKSGDKKLHDLDKAVEAVKAGTVRLEDFVACIADLDADAVARVFDGKDGRPVITTVKEGEPVYSVTAYPDAVAIFRTHAAELEANDAVLRDIMFSAPKPAEAPALVKVVDVPVQVVKVAAQVKVEPVYVGSIKSKPRSKKAAKKAA